MHMIMFCYTFVWLIGTSSAEGDATQVSGYGIAGSVDCRPPKERLASPEAINGISYGPVVWALTFFKRIRSMGLCFTGGL